VLSHTGMLSWSATETRTPVDVAAVTDPTVDPLLPGGRVILSFVDAVVNGIGISGAADALSDELGPEALVDAASVIGNFQMMNRVADGTGMPVGKGSRVRNAEMIARLGFDRFDHQEDDRR
jgi:hypothetical protein